MFRPTLSSSLFQSLALAGLCWGLGGIFPTSGISLCVGLACVVVGGSIILFGAKQDKRNAIIVSFAAIVGWMCGEFGVIRGYGIPGVAQLTRYLLAPLWKTDVTISGDLWIAGHEGSLVFSPSLQKLGGGGICALLIALTVNGISQRSRTKKIIRDWCVIAAAAVFKFMLCCVRLIDADKQLAGSGADKTEVFSRPWEMLFCMIIVIWLCNEEPLSEKHS